MSRKRAVSYFELLAVLALLALLVGAVLVPGYRAFSTARSAHAAAVTLAEDLALLERSAQNGAFQEGSSLIIRSTEPLSYACYHGRPADVDPQSKLGAVIVERSFSDVHLASGPISTSTPLLFASNGSAQFVSSGKVAPQHQVIAFTLGSRSGAGRSITVDLNLATGAVTTHE